MKHSTTSKKNKNLCNQVEVVIWKILTNTYKRTTWASFMKFTYPTCIMNTIPTMVIWEFFLACDLMGILNIYSLLLGYWTTKMWWKFLDNFIEFLKIFIWKCQTNFWQIDQLSSTMCQTGDLPSYGIRKQHWKSSTRTTHWRTGNKSHE